MIISGTGGSALTTVAAFLNDTESESRRRAKLPRNKASMFPDCEVLLRIPRRSRLPRDAQGTIAQQSGAFE